RFLAGFGRRGLGFESRTPDPKSQPWQGRALRSTCLYRSPWSGLEDHLARRTTALAVSIEHGVLIVDSDQRPWIRAGKGMRQHLETVPQDKGWTVQESRGHMPHLHPPLSPPSEKLDVRCAQLFRADHRRRPVVM